MNCTCGEIARFFVGRDGKPGYCCPHHRCKFYASTAIQCDGYHRIMPNAQTPPDTVFIRFESFLHPERASTGETDAPVMAVLAACQGNVYGRAEVCAVLYDPQFEGSWHTGRDAFVFPDWAYPRLVTALRRLQHVLVQEVPPFFFRCLTRMAQVVTTHREAVAAGKAATVDIEDAVYTQLKPFQKRGVDFIVEHDGRGMIADDMGLGKTVQAIAVAHLYRHEWPVLVLCPMSLMENWMKEFNKFAAVPYSRMVVLQGNKARVSDLHDVVIVSYSSLKCLDNVNFNIVIADESHYIKTGESKRAQQALRLCRSAKRVVLLSGTPATSRPLELYTQLQAIQPTLVPSKTQYGARYCNSYVSRFGVDMSGHSHTDELHVLLRHFMIRRTKRELGGELPSKTRQLLYVFITDKEKKALEKQVMALRRSIANHPDGTGQNAGGDYTSRAPNAFELKIATAQAKIPAVRDYVLSTVEQHLDSGEKIIFFAHHQCMMEALRSAVEAVRPKRPIDFIFIAGDTPAAQREQLANHFRTEPNCGVAVLSMQSSGTGHNFTCASTVVFAELDWNPSTHLQCEDRVHRIGQANPCHVKYLLAEGTSDSVIWPMLQTKLSVTSAMFASHNATGDDDGDAHSAADTHHLAANADQQKVARRDVSETTEGTQGTLDGFLKPSQVSGRSSASTPSAKPRLSANGQLPNGDGDEDVVVVDDGRAGTGTVACPPRTSQGPLSAVPALTPPSQGVLNAPVSPSPRPAAPSLPPAKPRVLIPLAEHEQQQRQSRIATVASFRVSNNTAAAAAAAAVAASTPTKPAEAKVSVLDLMRTVPGTHAAPPSGPLPSTARPVVVEIGGGGSSKPSLSPLTKPPSVAAAAVSASAMPPPWKPSAAPVPSVNVVPSTEPQALPISVASFLAAAAAIPTTTTKPSTAGCPPHNGASRGPAPLRTRTVFSFTKGPETHTAGSSAEVTAHATHQNPTPAAPPLSEPKTHTVGIAAPVMVSNTGTASQAGTPSVTRLAIPIGFKRSSREVTDAPTMSSASLDVRGGPRLEAAPVAMTTAMSSSTTTSAPPTIIIDPASLSATVTTKPRTTFTLYSQKPRAP